MVMKKYFILLFAVVGLTAVSSATISITWDNGKRPGDQGATSINCSQDGLTGYGACWDNTLLQQKTCPTYDDVKKECPNAQVVTWITGTQVGPMVNNVFSLIDGGTASGTTTQTFQNTSNGQWCTVTIAWQTLPGGAIRMNIDTALL